MSVTNHPAAAAAPAEPTRSSKRALEPIDRVSEVLFGLIMVLTFTGSLSVVEAGHAEVREMLVGALGCNLAWGVIDALLYLLGCLADKGRGLSALHALRDAGDAAAARGVIAHALPPLIASVVEPPELDSMRQRLLRLPEPAASPRLDGDDWRGALAVFLLVVASILPVVVPFLVLRDAGRALRISNGIAIAMLFLCGHAVGRLTRYHPWGTGVVMVLLGSSLVALTMALGG
jgi:VIT1/CCC1 family predicted Fe2+/Mn2+ transporter